MKQQSIASICEGELGIPGECQRPMTCKLLQFSLGEGCEGEGEDEASMPLADIQWAVAEKEKKRPR
jgi:hypothetical protein